MAALTSPASLDLLALATERFGIRSFRPGQRELIEAALAGQDALGILPTGGGKSLAYELPALVLGAPVVVVSPLIALMKDQCDHMDRAHVSATELDSSLSAADERTRASAIRAGKHALIYVTPERLRTAACIAMLKARGVSLLAVDEAHCASQWGHDFRPAYLAIAAARERLGNPPMLALTATATAETAKDIVEVLGLRAPRVVRASLVRENLAFEVRRCVNELAKRVALVELLYAEAGRSCIVYAATVKAADELFRWVSFLPAHLSVARYHAKMSARDREESRARFMNGTARVMIATKAFGMGIDKPDIRLVVHHQFPDSLESYYQEAGRAGRDGAPARCVLLYRLEDRRLQQFFLARKYPAKADVAKVLAFVRAHAGSSVAGIGEAVALGSRKVTAIVAHLAQLGLVMADRELVTNGPTGATTATENDSLEFLAHATDLRRSRDAARLEGVIHYAQSTTCRSRSLTDYFGADDAQPDCGRCDVCRSPQAKPDARPAVRDARGCTLDVQRTAARVSV